MGKLGDEKLELETELMALFHFTSPHVATILANGSDFLGDEEGMVYFAEHPLHVDGARNTGAICLIQWPKSCDLHHFRVPVQYESIDANDNVIAVPEEFAPKYDYIVIPVDIVNQMKPSVRCLGQEERKSMMT